MARGASGSVARQLGSLFEGGSAAGLSDRQLLERYIAGGRDPAGEAAFRALVGRHGPMVLGVCQQLLGDAQHAEDAFQAVFLVLAQKARSIRDPELLGNWLYGVALRTARCTRQQIARGRRREEGDMMRGPGAGSCVPAEPTAPPADRSVIDREQAQAIHCEVDRLPRAFRLPIVLCYFEGLTLDEAARRLRCPAGTVGSRLARAREKLRVRLTRRGVALPAAMLTAVLVPRSTSASIPPLLCDSTTWSAIQFAVGHAGVGGALSAPVVALAREVLRTMFFYKLKVAVLSLLVIATLATGTAYLTRSPATAEDELREAPKPQVAVKPVDSPRPAPGRMLILGRVLDPDGKPVQGAVVDVVTRFRAPQVGAEDDSKPWLTLLGQGQTDGAGRFRLDAPRTAASRVFVVNALAAAPGYGLGWAELNPDAEQPTAEIRLFAEQPLRVRLVDVAGAPAKGVEVQVLRIGRQTAEGQFDGVSISGIPPEGIRAWPRAVTTDDQGRITLTGIGRGRDNKITLSVGDLRYARQNLQVDTALPAVADEITLALQSARIIEGRVVAADTGQPIPGAVISIGAGHNRFGGLGVTRFRADDRGRFTANPAPGEFFLVHAFAPEGQPYLVPQVELTWTKGAVKTALNVPVPRGVLIRGKITEAGTNRPLAAAAIYFVSVGDRKDILSGWQAIVASKGDGSFQIAVPPGKGHLLVFGPSGDYIPTEIGRNRLEAGRSGGSRFRAHSIIPYELKAGDPPHEVSTALRPGVTMKGRVEGPDGQRVTDAFIVTALRVEATHPWWRGADRVEVRDGQFELHGLDPKGSSRISILDPDHEWGATIEFSGKQAGKDLTIRLQPCGKARARFVGPDGQPLARQEAILEFVASPGPSQYSRRTKQQQDELTADADFLANVDRKHYWDDPRTDADGRLTMISLIPGALYRILDFSTLNKEKGAQVRKDFTVKAGEVGDLGDILIEKPH